MAGWQAPPLAEQWRQAVRETLVGRTAALAEVEDAWTAADRGARQVVLVGGEAGSGKSRLVAEVATVLHDLGTSVLIGQCVSDLGPPYQPFAEPLAVLLDAGITDDPGEQAALRALIGADEGQARRPAFRRQLFAAAVAVVRAVCAYGPVLLVLEDLQWSGSAGQDLLSYLVQHTADCRLLVVATHRDAADRPPGLIETLAALQSRPGVRRLHLDPLTVADIAVLLDREDDSPASTAAEVRAQTGGNAYFVREVLRDRRSRNGPAPPSVRDAVQSRLARLGPVDAEIAGLAAVVGEEAELALLCAAADRPAGDVLAALDAGAAAAVLRPLGDADDAVRFVHTLARQAVLELLPAAVRMRLHIRVATEIEQRPATPRRIQRLAHHYAAAHPLGGTPPAIRYLTEAAVAAAGGLAHQDAARLYERAAALETDSGRRDAALLQAAQQLIHAGDFARARELAEQVATTGSAAHRLSAAIAFESASWRPGLPGYRAAELLDQALDGTSRERAGLDWIRGQAVLGRALTFTADPDPAAAHFVTAIDLARGSGNETLLMEALSASLWERRGPADDAGLDHAIELSDLARRRGDLVLLGPAANYRAMRSYLRGDPAGMDEASRELAAVARATGQAYFRYFATGAAYGRQFIRGHFSAAGKLCAAQAEIGRSLGTDEAGGPFGVQSFLIRRELGTLDQIRGLITGAEDGATAWAPGLLALYTEFGLREPAERMTRWILDQQSLRDDRAPQWPMILAFLVEAAVRFEDSATAASLRPALLAYAGRNLAAEPFVALFGSADRYLGLVDSLLGQGDPERSFASALALDTRMGAAVHVAQTLAATVAHRRRVRADEATTARLTDQALAIAEPLGLRRTLAALAPRTAAARPAGLTAREMEVLRLLGRGMSNREIARRLFITENTTANHVRSILTKTGARNRTQAARYATDQGLLR